MSEWAAKRFWTEAQAVADDDGWTVKLDGRGVKTPAKAALIVPTKGLAQAIAEEWRAQEDKIDPTTMPFTRMSNSAIDKVTPQKAEVADMLAAYGDSDLLCYRADDPEGLVSRQSDAWDPVLDWAAETLGARLLPRVGVMHAPQDAGALAELSRRTHALSPFELAAFHDLVSLTGSLILGFAQMHGHGDSESIWKMSRIDETWQEEQWGVDEEAEALAESKRGEFNHAVRFVQLCRVGE